MARHGLVSRPCEACGTLVTYATPFEPVVIALDWTRLHIEGAEVGPSEVYCKPCGRLMMPVGKNGDPIETIMKTFPIRTATGNAGEETPAKGCSPWVCTFCWRGVMVTR